MYACVYVRVDMCAHVTMICMHLCVYVYVDTPSYVFMSVSMHVGCPVAAA